MDERLRFVARLLEGEKMAALCREFDISRQTGHKFYNRYKDLGLEGLTDRSRRPYRQANRLPERWSRGSFSFAGSTPAGVLPRSARRSSAGPGSQPAGHQHRARGP